MEEKDGEVDDIESASSDSFIDDSDDDGPSISAEDDGLHFEVNLTEEEIEELISDLLEVESKLEKAVSDEMETFREDWEAVLDGLEKESAHLLEQLDGARVELPSLFKWIESQAPNGCSTEAWRKRTHWVGSQVTNDVTEFVSDAEKFLESNRPIRACTPN